jgi:uncharacterized protein YkwD
VDITSRCEALVLRVNLYRPDLRIRSLLCRVGAARSYQQAIEGRIWHDLRPVIRALSLAGVCWRNVGEVIAWNNYSGSARAFVDQWRRSPPHWDLLMARRYDRGGGSWVNYYGRHYAVMYVLDTCA